MIDLDAIRARLARVWGRWPTKGATAPGADEFGAKAWAAHGPLRCHATPQGRARGWKQANADADFIAAAPADIGALIAEVERLRSINDDYLLEMGRQHALLRDQAREAKTERAAGVAWLREWQNTMDDRITHDDLDYAIAVIERGEHRREGEK